LPALFRTVRKTEALHSAIRRNGCMSFS